VDARLAVDSRHCQHGSVRRGSDLPLSQLTLAQEIDLGALATHRANFALVVELAAVLHQETLRTGEFVGLTWQNSYGQTLVREISAGEFQRLGKISLVDIHY
jgi:hypothetical protein